MTNLDRRKFLASVGAGVAGAAALGELPAAAQGKALTVAYMPHPILNSQIDWMRKGATQA